jgi:hypothetical protein
MENTHLVDETNRLFRIENILARLAIPVTLLNLNRD